MLHQKNTVRVNLDDDVFASNDLSVAMPKYAYTSTSTILFMSITGQISRRLDRRSGHDRG